MFACIHPSLVPGPSNNPVFGQYQIKNWMFKDLTKQNKLMSCKYSHAYHSPSLSRMQAVTGPPTNEALGAAG